MLDRETVDFFAHLFDSLKREMNERFDRLEARMDRSEARLDRQGGFLQSGSRFAARMIEWTEKADGILNDRDRRIEELERRVRKLEDQRSA